MAIMITYYHLKQNKLGRSLQWTSAKHCNECTEHWVGLCHEGPALLATTFTSFAIINIFATKVFTLVVIWTDHFWVDCDSNWDSIWIFVLCQVCQKILPKVRSYLGHTGLVCKFFTVLEVVNISTSPGTVLYCNRLGSTVHFTFIRTLIISKSMFFIISVNISLIF